MKNAAMRRASLITALSLTCAVPLTTVSAQEKSTAPVTNVLLVHGAFADSTSWRKVVSLLQKKHLHVVTVDIPLTSFAADVETTKQAIAEQQGPVILVGHSYGGAVITEVGDDPKVTGLVYVAAYAPEVGQSILDLGAMFPKTPGLAEIQEKPAGLLRLTDKGINDDFAQDLSPTEKQQVISSQVPWSADSPKHRASAAAWKDKPSWYIVATKDRIIAPDLERHMAKTIRAHTIEVPAGHVVMLDHPKETSELIIQAASSK